jgi:GPH family glycoside/pentoside/hexuronide:cation symporter
MAFAAPTLPLAIVVFPAYAILPAFYARHTKISLSTIGVILMVSRIFDAVIDPMVGYISDNTRSRWGPRKPWLVLGAALLMVAIYQLYVPVQTVGVSYYAGWCLMFYLGFTLIDIPHKAWGTDISRSYMERSAVSTYLGASFAVGNLVFATVPFVPGLIGRGYDAGALRVVAILAVIVLPVSVGLSLWLAPQGRPVSAFRPNLGSLLRSIASNKPFKHFLLTFLLTGFGQGIFYGLVFMFVGSVQGLTAAFPIILLTDALATFAAIPAWFRIIAKIEKHRAWALGTFISAAAVLALIAAPSGRGGFAVLLALIAIRAIGGAVIYVAPHALLGDVIDYDILKTQINAAGNFNAAVTMVTKANGAIGSGAGLVLIGLIGFSAKGGNGPGAIMGFKIVVLVLPALLLFGSSAAAWSFPLNRRRHDIVRRRILARAASAIP